MLGLNKPGNSSKAVGMCLFHSFVFIRSVKVD